MDVHVLDNDPLLPLAAVAVERVEQRGKVRESLPAWVKCSRLSPGDFALFKADA
jgi:hypothetical protein